MERELRIQKWRAPKYPLSDEQSLADRRLRKRMKRKSIKGRRQLGKKSVEGSKESYTSAED